jgi:hypothetical protein
LELIASKKVRQQKKFPLLFVVVVGFGIRDRRSGIRDGKKLGPEIRDKHPGSATLLPGKKF